MQSNERRRHVEALFRDDCSSPYRQNQLITSPRTISHNQLVVEEEVSSSSVKEEKRASLSPASVITSLPELRPKPSMQEPRLVFKLTRRAHVRSESLGILSHGKRTMNIQEILASAAHNNTLLGSSSTLASKRDSTVGCGRSTASDLHTNAQ
uniref:AlNc14C10G1233 protein n=1 Tax=Albugo laibachii Nc14 TaxID=890382 RepID=F0W2I6_9STRA|nr:AlNc14C10G1233 [Albugo laibachii Nc14]|eukprot:CCA15272.1 AlNc14C10G1233 [Albugo laibachii Nc14]